MFRTLALLILFQSSTLARVNLHGQPLLTGVTSFSLQVTTLTMTKPTACFITSGKVSECHRKRGIKERPHIVYSDIKPSSVTRVEITITPQLVSPLGVDSIASSFDDSYFTLLFQQMKPNGRDNVVSVGDCGLSTVDFSQFLSCLSLTIQQTTTLTATFTLTRTLSAGYIPMTVLGCTPSAFPYVYCPTSNTNGETTTENTVVIWDSTLNPVIPESSSSNYPQYFFRQ